MNGGNDFKRLPLVLFIKKIDHFFPCTTAQSSIRSQNLVVQQRALTNLKKIERLVLQSGVHSSILKCLLKTLRHVTLLNNHSTAVGTRPWNPPQAVTRKSATQTPTAAMQAHPQHHHRRPTHHYPDRSHPVIFPQEILEQLRQNAVTLGKVTLIGHIAGETPQLEEIQTWVETYLVNPEIQINQVSLLSQGYFTIDHVRISPILKVLISIVSVPTLVLQTSCPHTWKSVVVGDAFH